MVGEESNVELAIETIEKQYIMAGGGLGGGWSCDCRQAGGGSTNALKLLETLC